MNKLSFLFFLSLLLGGWGLAQALPNPPFTPEHIDANFQFLIEVRQYEKGTNTLMHTVYFGNYNDATVGSDDYNVPGPPGDAPYTGTMVLPDTQYHDYHFQVYLKPSNVDNEWLLKIYTTTVNGTVPLLKYDLRWTILRNRSGYLDSRQLLLTSPEKDPIDMLNTATLAADTRTIYTIQCISSTLNVADLPRLTPLTLQLQAGWNLVGLPISLLNKNRQPLVKTGNTTYADDFLALTPFVLENGSYTAITQASELLGGRAYWIYRTEATSLELKGYDYLNPGFTPRDWSRTGWSLTGHLGIAENLPLPNDKTLCRWHEGRWQLTVDTLNDQTGYWIR